MPERTLATPRILSPLVRRPVRPLPTLPTPVKQQLSARQQLQDLLGSIARK